MRGRSGKHEWKHKQHGAREQHDAAHAASAARTGSCGCDACRGGRAVSAGAGGVSSKPGADLVKKKTKSYRSKSVARLKSAVNFASHERKTKPTRRSASVESVPSSRASAPKEVHGQNDAKKKKKKKKKKEMTEEKETKDKERATKDRSKSVERLQSAVKLLKPFKETAMVARKLAAVQKKALKKELAAIDARAAAAPGGAGAPSASAAAERARLVRDIKAISTHRDARRDGIFRELLESICAIFFAPRDEANDVGAAPASSRGARRGEIVASFKKFVPRAYHTLYSEVVAALERRAEGASS